MSQFQKLRNSLVLEFNSNYKKSDLVHAYSLLTKNNVNSKKNEIAEELSTIIIEDLSNSEKMLSNTEMTKQNIREELVKRLEMKLTNLNLRGQTMSKKIFDIINSEPITNFNYMSRLTKPPQQVIENIWALNSKQIKCLCPKAPSNLQQSKKIQVCYRCNSEYHSDCFWAPEKGEVFQCPFCYLKFCLPNKEVKQILFGGYLPMLKKQKVQYKCSFNLDMRIKTERSLNIEARCVKFNSKNKYEISWPDNASVSIGKNKVYDFKPLMTNSPLKRRADQPIKLDKCKLFTDKQLVIQERGTSENGYKLNKKCQHLVAVVVYTQLNSEAILARYEKSEMSIKESKKFLTQQMSHETNDIQIQKISISLKCQYFGAKIKIPGRSRLCSTHYQPFDLMNFITSSIHAKASTRKWKCPICDKRAYDLVIDHYILSLMKQNPFANQITFKENGEPEIFQGKDDTNLAVENNHIKQYVALQLEKKNNNVISLDEQEVIPQKSIKQIKHTFKEKDLRNEQQIKNNKTNKNETSLDQILNDDKRIPSRIIQNQQNKMKKLRKLNDGSYQVSNKDNKEKESEKKPFAQVVELLSSDDEILLSKEKEKPIVSTNKNLIESENKQSSLAVKNNKINSIQPAFKEKPKLVQQMNKNNQTLSNESQSENAPGNKPKPQNLQHKNHQKEVTIISIDSDNEAPIPIGHKSPQEIQKQLIEKMNHLRSFVNKQKKVEISQEDTQIFESIYAKILSFQQHEEPQK